MTRVQRQFRDAEAGFDVRTRAYGDSMRLTLHGATLLRLRDIDDVTQDHHFFETFLEPHVCEARREAPGSYEAGWAA